MDDAECEARQAQAGNARGGGEAPNLFITLLEGDFKPGGLDGRLGRVWDEVVSQGKVRQNHRFRV